jgi:hypothetical protein
VRYLAFKGEWTQVKIVMIKWTVFLI